MSWLQAASQRLLRRSALHDAALLALPLLVYLLLAGYQLRLPGLHNDEAQEAGLQAWQLASGAPVDAFRNSGLGPRQFPLMVQDYIGAGFVYLAAPFAWLLGPGTLSVRVPALVVGGAILLATYGCLASIADNRTALVGVALLAVQPSFVFWTRQGVLVASLSILCAALVLWAASSWGRNGGWQRAALLGLTAGFGLYAKLLFVWVLFGMMLAGLLLNAPLVLQPARSFWPRRPHWQEAAGLLAGFAAGCAPLIIYNLLSGGTLLSLQSNTAVSYYGVDNSALVSNLATRFAQLRAVVGGRDHLSYLGGTLTNPLWDLALLLSAVLIGFQPERGPRAMLLVMLFGFIATVFTVSGLFPHHLALFTPIWISIVALGLGRLLWRHDALSVVAGLILVPLFLRDVQMDFGYHRLLTRSGGRAAHSDAIERLAATLTELNPPAVAAMDWGFSPQVRLLTADRIHPQEIFGYEWDSNAEFAQRLRPLLQATGTLFVFHVNDAVFDRRPAFEALAKSMGYGWSRVQLVRRRDGNPIYEILRVQPAN